ncbi:MAG: hypothetical protein Q8M24_01990 [Pseudolabrys sp.]|nr:hypothetical protein [Pseudolabrys sp.]MDP2294218.1 hypothetical protein [Pseudolabrys sp.]
MNIDDPAIVKLREHVKAAQDVFDMAITLHEVWKPTTNDAGLHQRLGKSYATQAFNVVRVALRREMVLALMRLWDRDARAIGIPLMTKTLNEGAVMDALVFDLVSRLGISGAEDEVRRTLTAKVAAIAALVDTYGSAGAKAAALEKLRALRNQCLAHTQVKARVFTQADSIDDVIEVFYQDNAKIVSGLLSVVSAMAYDPLETGEVYSVYAKHFWASVRGERPVTNSDDPS